MLQFKNIKKIRTLKFGSWGSLEVQSNSHQENYFNLELPIKIKLLRLLRNLNHQIWAQFFLNNHENIQKHVFFTLYVRLASPQDNLVKIPRFHFIVSPYFIEWHRSGKNLLKTVWVVHVTNGRTNKPRTIAFFFQKKNTLKKLC